MGHGIGEILYDAWGKVTKTAIENTTEAQELLEVNPFLYRSYYYDQESKLYYLMSRYYDPEIGQFISPDSVNYLAPTAPNGVDLYAYCGYNPVMKKQIAEGYGGSVEEVSSISNPYAPEGLKIIVGVIPDIITGIKYLRAKGIHSRFVYSTNTRYYFPILGDTWRWIGKSSSSLQDFGKLASGSFRQILTGDAKAGASAIFKNFGGTVLLTTLANFGFNLYESGFDFTDTNMWLDTAIDTVIGVGSYYLAAGTMSLITAGLALVWCTVPGLIVVTGVVLLSIGYEWLIREITGYKA